MAQFSTCVRNKRADGFYPVYIRLAHNKGIQYIKTNFVVGDKGMRKVLSPSGKVRLEVSDKFVLKECLILIEKYAIRCNNMRTENMDSKMLLEALLEENKDPSFTDFSRSYINNMVREGKGSASNYKYAIKSLHDFMRMDNILFKQITSSKVSGWIESMDGSLRKKSLYPTCVKTLIVAAMRKYNDYENEIIQIRFNPFDKLTIPRSRMACKRSVSTATLKKFFSYEPGELNRGHESRALIAHDVCLMIFCLAGINAADLYDMDKDCLNDWVLRYHRKKTRGKRDDNAYMEISVPEIIRPLFDRYKGRDKLFSFSERYSTQQVFVICLNWGCGDITKDLGIEDNITTYVFRHSWATIAQNDCKASTELVAFSLNHSSAHKITEGYIKKSYKPVDEINAKVIKKVFGLNKN